METIKTHSGLTLQIEKNVEAQNVELSLRVQSPENCVLHWGLRPAGQQGWKLPPETVWPANTRAVGAAAQTPFSRRNGYSDILVRLPVASRGSIMDFVLFFPDRAAWDNNGGRNYQLELPAGPGAGPALEQAIQTELGQKKSLFQRVFDAKPEGRVAALVTGGENRFVVTLLSDVPGPLCLHWGLSRYSSNEWFVPPPAVRPPGTDLIDERAAQTPFHFEDGFNRIRIEFAEADAPMGLQFVLKQSESNQWLKFQGGNFFVPVRMDYQAKNWTGPAELRGIADEIIAAETGKNSWTLMHRFNLCYELLDKAGNSPEGLALIFVWLRYSALRQLTWQRNYNTKPRELSHAEDRLTQKLAALYNQNHRNPPASRFVRLMLTSVGPGGDGQRIRDEILAIMHRHHVKEVSGHFLEEWHQKLHNNTTPDDIAICQAYLEFLSSNGNQDRFYQKLQENGVTRQRLETFERPIRSHPDFVPHLKDALLHDFGNFLNILRSVHEGTDLDTAIHAAGPHLDKETQDFLWRIRDQRHRQTPLPDLARDITEGRRRLNSRLRAGNAPREFLYLDLALEQSFRTAIEYQLEQVTDPAVLAGLIATALENRLFSGDDAELDACLRHWRRLEGRGRPDADWALHAKAVVDRIARVVSDLIDRTYELLQPKAELLGHAFHADAWVISLFSEEVVRGGSLDFALSLLLRRLEPALRQIAQLGNWQIVSRGRGAGLVEIVDELRAVQGKQFDGPRVIVADKVRGDEEIPEAVTAVIAPDVTDIVSHVAVRARNAGLLFATCYDSGTFSRLKNLRGKWVRVEVSPAGDVSVAESEDRPGQVPSEARPARRLSARPAFKAWVLSSSEFTDALTGGKALNLARLGNKLPEWIHRPSSIAVPFGIFEKVLERKENKPIAAEYESLRQQAGADPDRVLPQLRETVLKLAAPPELLAALRARASEAGLRGPLDAEEPWQRIKQVWASKWNDRAYHSRVAQRIPHEDLLMSVLIQQVVEADYAFVMHTANPFTGRRDELYVEIVVGLGETLVGNYPGRALSAVCDKKTRAGRVLSYPGKSQALRGGGLIFRSDSNGEDLAGFAGAGLYDSVLLPPPDSALVDYSNERLAWDEPFRTEILRRLTELGSALETASGAPQDIEGVLSHGEYFVVQSRPQVGAGGP